MVTKQHYFLDVLERRLYKQMPDRTAIPSPLPSTFYTHDDIEKQRLTQRQQWEDAGCTLQQKPLCHARNFLETDHHRSIYSKVTAEHAAVQERHAIEAEKDLSLFVQEKKQAERDQRAEVLRKAEASKNWKVSMAKPLDAAQPVGYIT